MTLLQVSITTVAPVVLLEIGPAALGTDHERPPALGAGAAAALVAVGPVLPQGTTPLVGAADVRGSGRRQLRRLDSGLSGHGGSFQGEGGGEDSAAGRRDWSTVDQNNGIEAVVAVPATNVLTGNVPSGVVVAAGRTEGRPHVGGLDAGLDDCFDRRLPATVTELISQAVPAKAGLSG